MATRIHTFPSVPSVPPSEPTPRSTPFLPPPAELTGFLTLPREPEAPALDACGKRFFMEMDWADHASPSSNR